VLRVGRLGNRFGECHSRVYDRGRDGGKAGFKLYAA
jgi:hypothetical protein